MFDRKVPGSYLVTSSEEKVPHPAYSIITKKANEMCFYQDTIATELNKTGWKQVQRVSQ